MSVQHNPRLHCQHFEEEKTNTATLEIINQITAAARDIYQRPEDGGKRDV